MATTPPQGRRDLRRCGECGSRAHAGASTCDVCGAPLPRRWIPFRGVRLSQSVLAVLVVALTTASLLALRRWPRAPLAEPEGNVALLVSQAPTAAPTFTPRPPPSMTPPPPTAIPPTATAMPAVITYTVVSGDTLSGIAQQFQLTTDDLVTSNEDSLESADDLRIGQQLRVPVARVAVAEDDLGAEAPPEAAGAGATAAEEPLAEEVARALGLPPQGAVGAEGPDATTSTAPPRPGGAAGVGTDGQAKSVVEKEIAAARAFPAPWPVAPADGATVTGEGAVLRWSSAGVLPPGVHYAVEIRDADEDTAPPRTLWVMSNATVLRLPGELRPPRGTSRRLAWRVSVRRRQGGLMGDAAGEPAGPPSPERQLVWSP